MILLLKHSFYDEYKNISKDIYYNKEQKISKIFKYDHEPPRSVKKLSTYKYDENGNFLERIEEIPMYESKKVYDKNNKLIFSSHSQGINMDNRKTYTKDGRPLITNYADFKIKRVFKYDEKDRYIGFTRYNYFTNEIVLDVNFKLEDDELKEVLYDKNKNGEIDAIKTFITKEDKLFIEFKILKPLTWGNFYYTGNNITIEEKSSQNVLEYKEDRNLDGLYEYTLKNSYDENKNFVAYQKLYDENYDGIYEKKETVEIEYENNTISLIISENDEKRAINLPIDTKDIVKTTIEEDTFYNDGHFILKNYDSNDTLVHELKLSKYDIEIKEYDSNKNTIKDINYYIKNSNLVLSNSKIYKYDKNNNQIYRKYENPFFIKELDKEIIFIKEDIFEYNDKNQLLYKKEIRTDYVTYEPIVKREESHTYNSNGKILESKITTKRVSEQKEFYKTKEILSYSYMDNNLLKSIKEEYITHYSYDNEESYNKPLSPSFKLTTYYYDKGNLTLEKVSYGREF